MTTATERLSFSGWIDPPADPAPALEGERGCDVVVIGGGLTGMAAALRLDELGADVVLLESAFCGWGASSRNAGHLTPTIGGDPQLLATLFRRRAAELVRLADGAVHFTEGLIADRGIDCEYEPGGNVSAALTEDTAANWEARLKPLGIPAAAVRSLPEALDELPEAVVSAGDYRLVRSSINVGDYRPDYRPPPLLGEHSHSS